MSDSEGFDYVLRSIDYRPAIGKLRCNSSGSDTTKKGASKFTRFASL